MLINESYFKTCEQASVVRDYFNNILNLGNLAALYEIVDTNILFKGLGLPILGIDASKHLVSKMRSSFKDSKYTLERIIGEENKVAVWWTQIGVDAGYLQNRPSTCKRIINQGINIFEVIDGKISKIWYQHDNYGLLRQLDAIPCIITALEAGRDENDLKKPQVTGRTGKMPSSISENKALIRRYSNAIMNGCNLDTGPELTADDCDSKLLSYFMTSSLRGSEKWVPVARVLLKGIPDIEVSIDDEVAEGNTVVIRWTAPGTQTDILMDQPIFNMPIVLDGITW
jgi:predicted ester cyclase